MLRAAGRMVVAGQYTDAGDATINPHADLTRKHVEVRGCWGIDYSRFHRAVRRLARHGEWLALERLITGRYPLAKAGEALADVAAGRAIKALVGPKSA